MPQIIETGTDVAMVCFFDPAEWPANTDEKQRASLKLLQKLSEEGRVWFAKTGADGAYLFHFYVDEEIPDGIKVYAEDPQEIKVFPVSSGSLVACGAEYASRDPQKTGLGRFPHMGGSFKLASGNYAVKAWRMEWPEDMIEDAIEKRLGSKRVKKTNRIGLFTGVLLWPTVLISPFTLFRTLAEFGDIRLGTKLLWAFLAISWPTLIFLMRKVSRLTENPERKEIERQYPSIVVQMRRIP
jgi:hypothetical protein